MLWHVSAVYVRMDAALLSPFGALPYVINLCVRFALPMFMMISGALLLRESYAFNFKQKFSYIIKLYAVWSLVWYRRPGDARSQRWHAAVAGGDACQLDPRTVPFLVSADAVGRLPADAAARPPEGLQTLNCATLLLFCHHLHLQSAVAVPATGGQRRRRAGE